MKRLVSMVALALAGCSDPVEPGFVALNWSQNMRELQIQPVFPPREDVVVGHVYLTSAPPEIDLSKSKDGSFLPISVLLTSIQPAHRGGFSPSSAHYRRQPSFPETNTAIAGYLAATRNADGSQKPDALTKVMPVPTARGDVFTQPGATNRLRQVAFPDFMKASVRGGDLSALIPFDILTLGLGFSGESVESFSISVPVAESYGVPLGDLLLNLVDPAGRCFQFTSLNPKLTPQAIFEISKSLRGPNEPDGEAYLTLISEVYYARTFDVKIDLSRTAGAAVRAQLGPTGIELPAPGLPAPDTSTTAGSARATGQRATELSQKQASPGVAASFYMSDTGSIGVRRTFAQPIAIGYRGITLKIGANNTACAVPAPLPRIKKADGTVTGTVTPLAGRSTVNLK